MVELPLWQGRRFGDHRRLRDRPLLRRVFLRSRHTRTACATGRRGAKSCGVTPLEPQKHLKTTHSHRIGGLASHLGDLLNNPRAFRLVLLCLARGWLLHPSSPYVLHMLRHLSAPNGSRNHVKWPNSPS